MLFLEKVGAGAVFPSACTFSGLLLFILPPERIALPFRAVEWLILAFGLHGTEVCAGQLAPEKLPLHNGLPTISNLFLPSSPERHFDDRE